MNNEFRSAAQKKGDGRVMRNNESHWSGLTEMNATSVNALII
jgi:hypothetical protein